MFYTIVSIADMKTSTDAEDILVTYSLGSCAGVTLFDPIAKVGGLLHCMLPLSNIDAEKAKKTPFMFADTGMTSLTTELIKSGAQKNRLVATISGCANIMDAKNIFNIGRRNYKVVKKFLEKNKIRIIAENVGGTCSRTVFLYLENGEVAIKQ